MHSCLGDIPWFALTQLRTPGFSLAPCGLVLCELHFVSVTHGALQRSALSGLRPVSCSCGSTGLLFTDEQMHFGPKEVHAGPALGPQQVQGL